MISSIAEESLIIPVRDTRVIIASLREVNLYPRGAGGNKNESSRRRTEDEGLK